MSGLIEQGPFAVFFGLVVVHALADFPLQGAYLAQYKNRHTATSRSEWIVALSAHSLIHAGGVWLITGSMLFGGIELILHALIDTVKSDKRIGLLTDQSLHLLCKAGYVAAITLTNIN